LKWAAPPAAISGKWEMLMTCTRVDIRRSIAETRWAISPEEGVEGGVDDEYLYVMGHSI
jgi:hypothetical protein